MKLSILIGVTAALIQLKPEQFPTYLPGAIANFEGTVALISDYLTVPISYKDLLTLPQKLISIADNVNYMKHDLKILKATNMTNTDHDLLITEISSTVESINNKLKLSLTWFPTEKSNRQKRGLLNIVGIGLHYLFGTVTQDEMLALDARITTLQDARLKNNLLIEGLVGTQKEEIQKINELVNSTNIFYERGIELESSTKITTKLAYLSHYTLKINNDVNEIIAHIRESIDALSLATRNIINTHLVSQENLKLILDNAKKLYNLQPLFDNEHTYLYYTYFTVQIAPMHLILHIPMSTDYTFKHYSILPFPTFQDEKTIKLNITNTVILISDNLEYYIETDNSNLQTCSFHNNYMRVCHSSNMMLQRFTQVNTCQSSLLSDTIHYSKCQWIDMEYNTEVKTIPPYIFIYRPSNTTIRINCDKSVEISHARNLQLLMKCEVHDEFLTIFRTTFSNLQMPTSFNADEVTAIKHFTLDPKTNISKLTILQPVGKYTFMGNSTTKIIIPSISTIGLVIIILVVIYCIKRKRSVSANTIQLPIFSADLPLQVSPVQHVSAHNV